MCPHTSTGDRCTLDPRALGVGRLRSSPGSAPLRPAGPPARSPVARTHSAWVKALSPSGTAVSPFPEQSTRRSPSQLQGAAQRGGAAPLGPAEPSSPRARKQSSRSGPGIAAAAARARLSRGASRSARLGCPPPPPGAAGLPDSGPGRRPSAVRVRSLPSAVRRCSARTRRSAVSPFPLLHGRARAAPAARWLRPAGPAQSSCRGRALPSPPPPPPVPGLLQPHCSSRLRSAASSHAGPAPQPPPRLSQTPRLSAFSPPRLPLWASFSLLGLHARLRSPRPPGYANHLGTCKTNPAPRAPLVKGGLELITMQVGDPLLVKSRGACLSGVSDKVVLLLLVVGGGGGWWWRFKENP